jgi:hypothetical protein
MALAKTVVVSHLGLVVSDVAYFSITKWLTFRFKNGFGQLITWERFRVKIGPHFRLILTVSEFACLKQTE